MVARVPLARMDFTFQSFYIIFFFYPSLCACRHFVHFTQFFQVLLERTSGLCVDVPSSWLCHVLSPAAFPAGYVSLHDIIWTLSYSFLREDRHMGRIYEARNLPHPQRSQIEMSILYHDFYKKWIVLHTVLCCYLQYSFPQYNNEDIMKTESLHVLPLNSQD